MLPDDVTVKLDGGQIKVDPRDETKRARSQWGTSRTLVANLIAGVTKGFEQRLEINGVGYRAAVQGKNLQLALGYSHDVVYPIPEGITIATPRPVEIVITGIDRQKVGQVAAEIREYPSAGALQGQGRQICRRTHLPQGRQEEVTEPPMTKLKRPDRAAQGRVRGVVAARGRRAQAALGVPLVKHIYAQVIDDDAGRHARLGVLDREDDARGPEDRRQRRRGEGGRQARSPSARRRRASRTSCSTAAAISITAASRRWPKPRARAG